MGFKDDEFYIEATGGDRRERKVGEHISTTNGSVVVGSDDKSPHLIKNGARGVDFKFSANIPKSVVKNILESFPEIVGPWGTAKKNIKSEYNNHLHFNLMSQFRYEPGDTLPNIEDYEILPTHSIFNEMPTYYNMIRGKE